MPKQQRNIAIILALSFINITAYSEIEYELKEEVVGKNKKEHAMKLDLSKKSSKKDDSLVDKDQEEERPKPIFGKAKSSISSTIEDEYKGKNSLLNLKNNNLIFGIEAINSSDIKITKVNPFKYFFDYSKNLSIFKLDFLFYMQMLRDINESFIDNNRKSKDHLKSSISHEYFNIDCSYSIIDHEIPFLGYDATIADARNEKLLNCELNVMFPEKVGVDLGLNYNRKALVNKLFKSRDYLLNYFSATGRWNKNYLTKNNMENLIEADIKFIMDKISGVRENYIILLGIRDRYKGLFNDLMDLKGGATLELLSKSFKGGLNVGVELFPSDNFLIECKSSVDYLTKPSREIFEIFEEYDRDILPPQNLKDELNYSIIDILVRSDFIPNLNLAGGYRLQGCQDKIIYKDGVYANKGNPITVSNWDGNMIWNEVLGSVELDIYKLNIEINYLFNTLTGVPFISKHKLDTKLEVNAEKLSIILLNKYKSGFNTKIGGDNLDYHLVFDFMLAYDILENFTWTFKISNIFNSQAYYKTYFPIERRTIGAEFKFVF